MKNIYDVISQKEAELEQLQKQIEALRLAARLLTDETDNRVAAAAVGMGATPARPAPAASAPQPAASGLRQFP